MMHFRFGAMKSYSLNSACMYQLMFDVRAHEYTINTFFMLLIKAFHWLMYLGDQQINKLCVYILVFKSLACSKKPPQPPSSPPSPPKSPTLPTISSKNRYLKTNICSIISLLNLYHLTCSQFLIRKVKIKQTIRLEKGHVNLAKMIHSRYMCVYTCMRV